MSVSIHLGGGKCTRTSLAHRRCLAGVRQCGRVFLAWNRSHDSPSKKNAPAPDVHPATPEQSPVRGRCQTLPLPIAPKSEHRLTNGDITRCGRVGHRQAQNSDLGPGLAYRRFGRDQRVRRLAHFQPGVPRIHPLGTDHKLPYHAWELWPERSTAWEKAWLAMCRQSPVRPRFRPRKHPLGHDHNSLPIDACRRARRAVERLPASCHQPFARCLRAQWPRRAHEPLSLNLLVCFCILPWTFAR